MMWQDTSVSEYFSVSIFASLHPEDGGSKVVRKVNILHITTWCRNPEGRDLKPARRRYIFNTWRFPSVTLNVRAVADAVMFLPLAARIRLISTSI
jgi:hypothetical protein